MNLFKWLTAPLWLLWETLTPDFGITMIFCEMKSHHSRLCIMIAHCYLLSMNRTTLWVGTTTGVRWLNHHGNRKGRPINSLHRDEILYFSEGGNQELCPPTLLLIDLVYWHWFKGISVRKCLNMTGPFFYIFFLHLR